MRQLMGHTQFGARVVYGDCLFATVSPNEQHSALVLRLSRYRRNDPYVRFGDAHRQRCCTAEHPRMEAQRRPGSGSTPGRTGQCVEDITIDLPEYDLRRAYTAQDPLAVIEAYKVEILFRLGILLGVRICPHCPRCNETPLWMPRQIRQQHEARRRGPRRNSRSGWGHRTPRVRRTTSACRAPHSKRIPVW